MFDRRHAARLRNLWDYLRTSFWFVPGGMALLALVLVWIAIRLDQALTDQGVSSVPWLIYTSPAVEAREVLVTLLGSMITMASLVFSITMVVLTLAASQFGPRLIRNFMASPQTQFVLGTFVMTIVYCLLMLAAVGSGGEEGLRAYGSVSIAIVLTLASVALLIVYLHVLARSIMSETVIQRVGGELDDLLDGFGPLSQQAEDPIQQTFNYQGRATFFGPRRAGYVQAIEFDELVAIAMEANVFIAFSFRAGDFVAAGGRGIALLPAERLDQEIEERVLDCIIVGAHRTPVQDPDFSIRHLVEIAVRALSSAVNDPYTAISAINQLSASFSKMMGRALPQGVFRDAQGEVRVLCPRPTYETLLDAGFDQVRQNSGDKPVVTINLLEAIARIAEHAHLPEQRQALAKHLDLVMQAARRGIQEEADLQDLARRAEHAGKLLQSADRGAPD
jgi:uncharacterized membrane protein